jgi:hypothetical protein
VVIQTWAPRALVELEGRGEDGDAGDAGDAGDGRKRGGRGWRWGKTELDASWSLRSAQRFRRAYCVEVSGAHGR